MTKIYYQIVVKGKDEPDAHYYYPSFHYTKEQAIADAERRLTEGQTAEFVRTEYA